MPNDDEIEMRCRLREAISLFYLHDTQTSRAIGWKVYYIYICIILEDNVEISMRKCWPARPYARPMVLYLKSQKRGRVRKPRLP